MLKFKNFRQLVTSVSDDYQTAYQKALSVSEGAIGGWNKMNDDTVTEDTAAVEEQLDSTEDTVVEESIIGDKDASETSSNNVQYNNKKNRNKNKHSNNK